MSLFALLACPGPDTGDLSGTACDDASARVGATACVEEVGSRDTWRATALEVAEGQTRWSAKYLVPVSADQPVPTAYVNTQRYDLHYDFLREAFADDYGLLQWNDYVAMIIDPAQRAYFGGNVYEREVDGQSQFDFIVWDDPADPSTAPTRDDVAYAWTELQSRFAIGDIAFSPSSGAQAEAAAGWDEAFTVRDDGRDVR